MLLRAQSLAVALSERKRVEELARLGETKLKDELAAVQAHASFAEERCKEVRSLPPPPALPPPPRAASPRRSPAAAAPAPTTAAPAPIVATVADVSTAIIKPSHKYLNLCLHFYIFYVS